MHHHEEDVHLCGDCCLGVSSAPMWQVLLSALQERRERKALDVEEAAVAAAANAAAQSSHHDSAKGQWDFAQRVQRATQHEEEVSLASARSVRRAHHQRHGSGSDKESLSHTHRRPAEVDSLS